MRFTKRIADLKPEGAYQVLAKAQELEAGGRDIIHLEIGQPDIDTFEHISSAGMDAISSGATRYTHPAGLRDLREVIAQDAGARRGVDLSALQVVISPGAKPSLLLSTLALVQTGDEVLYPDPGFPTYPAMIRLAGGIPIPVPLIEQRNFALDFDALSKLITGRTKMVIVNSPSNPTGGILPNKDLRELSRIALEYDLWVLSDEIYSRMVYKGFQHESIIALPGMQERTILVDGFSKTYAMTGWRLGYGIVPIELADRLSLLMTHAFGCTAHFTQIAGIQAISGPQTHVDEMVMRYQLRRDLIVDGLNRIPGVSCQLPAGAFYAFPNISATGLKSDVLANLLLNDAGVAVLPGTAFGKLGEGFLRVSYANSSENIREALKRMQHLFENL